MEKKEVKIFKLEYTGTDLLEETFNESTFEELSAAYEDVEDIEYGEVYNTSNGLYICAYSSKNASKVFKAFDRNQDWVNREVNWSVDNLN